MEACKEPVKLGLVFPAVEAGRQRRRNYWFLPAELCLIFAHTSVKIRRKALTPA